MTDGRPGGRFERHPRLTGALLLAVALGLVELGLRLFPPVPLRFAHEMRRLHRYSRSARVDLRPSQSGRLRLDRTDGQPLLDFRLTTGPDGFRVVDDRSAAAAPANARFVHAIGDSYTMGWGVEASDSYPALLARRLEPQLQVINLGVDGFGAIGATRKSLALADRFPPVLAVYLFSPNDFEDDERAAAVARRGVVSHAANEALDFVRRESFLAGVPFALRYRLQFQAGPARPSAPPPAAVELLVPPPAALPEPPKGHPTFQAIGEYRDALASRGARLLVLVLSTQPESLAAYRFCREQGIEAHLFELPPTLRLPDEGHFNAAGNRAVAELVARLVRGGHEGTGAGG